MRIPIDWKNQIDQGRLLILSPFDEKLKRPTVSTSKQRNHLVAMLGRSFLIPYADAGSKTEQLVWEIIESDGKIYSFKIASNEGLIRSGAIPIGTDAKAMRGFALASKSG
jgi:hypothetical protein